MSVKLAHQTQKTAGIGNGMRTATIAAVNGNAVTLSISGGLITSGVGVLDSYTPAVGDVVAVFRQDSSWLVMGAITPPASGMGPRNIQTGSLTVAISAAISSVTPVTFPVPFPVAPVVMTNFESATIFRTATRPINITNVGFQVYTFTTEAINQTFSGQPVSWTATARS